MTILPLTYLGNLFFYAHLINDKCVIDQHSHYVKQTYNNRCSILTANGVQDLIVPVVKPKTKSPIKDIRISSHEDWSLLHWRAIESAYNSTPFFVYFRDEYASIYEKKWDFLVDFDFALLEKTLDILNFSNVELCLSDNYMEIGTSNVNDYREIINPKKFDVSLHDDLNIPYYQVFTEKFGFIPNLSIIDLLFNLGLESRIYLKNIVK